MGKGGLSAEAKGMVSGDRLWGDLEALARWERYTGTEGEWAAARYIRDRLGGEGISVTLHKFEAYISLPGGAGIEVLEPERKRLPCTTHCFGASTGPAGVEGEVVRVEEGGEASAPVAGKVALVEGLVSPGRFFDLEREGAIAQVFANKGEVVHELTVSTVWGTPTPESLSRLPRTPVASIPRSLAAPLIEALRAGRRVRLRLRAEVDTRWRPVEMPVASVEVGEGEFALVGGHLDSWYLGAMDNAAGDALMMELARLFQRLRPKLLRGLRVGFWVGHSHGRFAGSAWYADQFWADLREGCVAYLNIDQPGFRDGRAYRPFATADIAGWVREAVREEGNQDVPPLPPRRNADQSFWGLGVPSFSFAPNLVPGSPDWPADRGEMGLPWYWHHREDTLDKIDRGVLLEHARFYAAALADLLAQPLLPLDPAALGEAIGAELVGIAREAGEGFDLGPAREAAGRFVERARELRGRMGAISGASRARELNRSLLRASQRLNSVLYTEAGPYGQDPARASQRLPGLQGARSLPSAPAGGRGFLLTQLIRERNRLVDALGEGAEEVERALARL